MSDKTEAWGRVGCDAVLGRTFKSANSKNDVERWLDGEISMGRLIHNSSLETCYAQASDLIGGIWQSVREKAYELDAELERRIKAANDFKALAESGDTERTTKSDIEAEPIRAAALQEARMLLRFHLLGRIDQTGAGVP